MSIELRTVNHGVLWIPEGFVAREEDTHFKCKTTAYYARYCEAAIRWDDAALAIVWPPGPELFINQKDREATGFAKMKVLKQ